MFKKMVNQRFRYTSENNFFVMSKILNDEQLKQ